MTYRQVLYNNLKKNNKYLNTTVITDVFLYYSKLDITHLSLSLDNELCSDNIIVALSRIEKGEPVQYVLNESSFLGSKFYVDENVLIPRQETEQLVMDLVSLIMSHFGTNKVSILEIGAGSGCVSLSLDRLLGEAKIDASDISVGALEVCEKNKSMMNSKVNFIHSDMFESIPLNKYDVIVSNPPYIEDESTIDEQVFEFEPHLALISKPDTFFYEEIIKNIDKYLSPKGILAFEIGETMQEKLEAIIKQYLPTSNYVFGKDIYDRTRFLYIIRG